MTEHPKIPSPQQGENCSPNCTPALAVERATLLASCYRRDDAADPRTYLRAVSAVLAEYPEAVVVRVTDPRTGLARRLKWLPNIAEISEVCDRELRVHRMDVARAARGLQPLRREWRDGEEVLIAPECSAVKAAPALPRPPARELPPEIKALVAGIGGVDPVPSRAVADRLTALRRQQEGEGE